MARTPSSKTPFEAYIDKLNASPGRIGILTEGDSWFALPFPKRPNIVDVRIHPDKGGFEKVAAKVRVALAERFPSLG